MRVTTQCSDEFKSDALHLIRRGDRSINQVARDLGVSHWTLRGWLKNEHMMKRRKKEPGKPASAGTTAESPQQRLERLERENERLRKEKDSLRTDREILKEQRPSSRRKANEVRVHPRGEGVFSGRCAVSTARSDAAGLLRLRKAAGERSGRPRADSTRAPAGPACREQRDVWQPAAPWCASARGLASGQTSRREGNPKHGASGLRTAAIA